MDTTHEITKLVKKSPARDAMFKKLKVQCESVSSSPGIRVLCPTRWTVRANALQSIVNNYPVAITAVELFTGTCMRHRDEGKNSRCGFRNEKV